LQFQENHTIVENDFEEEQIFETEVASDFSGESADDGKQLSETEISFNEEEDIFEQDVYDALFEAGYDIEEINKVTASVPEFENRGHNTSESESSETSDFSGESATKLLKETRIKNINRLMIGTLNINGLASKFEQLKEVLQKHLDILIIQETKLDSGFPPGQFIMEGYSKPYRLDRNRFGGGVMIYVRENIPSKLLTKHTFTETIEGLFIEINLRKTKLLLFGGYRSEHKEYGVCAKTFFHEISLALDKYVTYEKILLAGDFNIKETNPVLEDFLYEHSMKNNVKENTCFKNLDNPSCIDLFLTNTPLSFQHTATIATGLSDFHKMVVTVMKTTCPKAEPKIIYYRDYKKFDLDAFRKELRTELKNAAIAGYAHFELIFLQVLEKHAPVKKKVIRGNDKPFMNKTLRKAIMRRSALKNKYFKSKTDESHKAFKKQKNYTKRLFNREIKKYWANLDLSKFTDNKKFWDTIKPLFS
jgi:exonuclease III